MLFELYQNIIHNMFKPLLLFFYLGFSIPLLKVKLEFPKVFYQCITIYLLLAIGWHGGEELASLSPSMLGQAVGLMLVGLLTNTVIAVTTYGYLRKFTSVRRIDAATIAGYYGSDSAGTFLTCVGVLTAASVAFAPYMPVLLAVMEIPGCLVALYLVSRLRQSGLDAKGNAPDEPGYEGISAAATSRLNARGQTHHQVAATDDSEEAIDEEVLVGAAVGYDEAARSESSSTARTVRRVGTRPNGYSMPSGSSGNNGGSDEPHELTKAEKAEATIALQSTDDENSAPKKSKSVFSGEMLHEVFMNPGIFLLFAGILIGFIGRLQGEKVIAAGDQLFVNLFQGVLCMFLLEMGMTAAQKLPDLKRAGAAFVAFALLAPNVFAIFGMTMLHLYSMAIGQTFEHGTYVLFAVLCGAASYIAVPAVQRMAIPEASPTLPLAASLGVTFTYNVTIGIPLYLSISKFILQTFPIAA